MKTFEVQNLKSKKTNFINDFEATNLEIVKPYQKKGGEIRWLRCKTPNGKNIAVEEGEVVELHNTYGGVLLAGDGKELQEVKEGMECVLSTKIKFAREAGELMVLK